MPISKTCYFCDLYPSGMIECDGNHFTKECFTPNADWLYIEQLQEQVKRHRKYGGFLIGRIFRLVKENKELKTVLELVRHKDIEQLEKENEELKAKLNPVQKIFKVGDVITN